MTVTCQAQFYIGDRVNIDYDTSIRATVTAVTFRKNGDPVYEVSYVHNGDPKCFLVEEWRLQRAT